ncbi:MAG: type I DNA topoisomerase [Clostridiales bacterium]|jgi:DNA topoisomerase-1|nr:type I DNA topoisomerase [Clostridiales bacterium]
MKTLVIVESPTKAKTISKMLGRNYAVKSSFGHVRDLPKSTLGVDVENHFEPRYITIRGKGDVLKTLKDEAKKADRILLASDPDREGEAIAWHLREHLRVTEEKCRIEFNEITAEAVKRAASTPRPIDMDRVEAQQARRILDRLVGYKISPLLWKKVKKGLSAGRVQSVAVRLICDREEEIRNFISEEYWTLAAHLDSGKGPVIAKLIKQAGKKPRLSSQDDMQNLLDYLADKSYQVKSIQQKEKKRSAAPPFTTSTLQQEASRRLGMVTRKTMQTAQQLYEGINVGSGVVGLITYMRTDSVRIAGQAQEEARAFVMEKYGKDYVPPKPNIYASRGRTQEAHEAIRPSSVARTPGEVKPFLTPLQYKLYKLIWERFVASQMSPAIMDTVSVDIGAGVCLFKASGSVVRFAGFMQVYIEGQDKEEEEESGLLPPLQPEQILPLIKLDPKQHFTQPPPRYTDATLVKALEELGVGRPSTYAPTIDTIINRNYVAREAKQFYPTELGQVVLSLLMEYFESILDTGFTAGMESRLDLVEEGDLPWRQVLEDFYPPFYEALQHAEAEMEKIVVAPEESGEACEKCGKPMVYRMGAYGRFLACSGFPDCRNTKAILIPTNVKCLACGGNIVQRKTKTGRIFYGCDHYPGCAYVAWDLPIEKPCPVCGWQMTVRKLKNGEEQEVCPNKDCPAKGPAKPRTTRTPKEPKAVKEKKTTAKTKKTTSKK